MKALQPGTTLKNGKYTINKILGQGSFGITYLAATKIPMQGDFGKMDVDVKVAIKEFFMADLNSRSGDGTSLEKTDSSIVKKYAKKFYTEAENLAKLNHPNIVKVLEVFNENNTSYYVMEYIEGETLDDYIKRNGKIGEEEARLITLDICGALRHMHDHHMLHLDLKPKNVMRDQNGKIYLIDFGLAKQYNENGEPESSTTLGLGTRGYAPVEQMKYKSDGTMPATLDVYALGASLFKMLTGQVPPESSDVLNEGLPMNLLQNAGVSQDMIGVVEKAMAPLKKNRYQNVGELIDALTVNVPQTEETVVEPHDEETEIQHEETELETPPPYNNEVPPPYNNDVSPYQEEEERSFLQKYWKYGLIALIPLLILGGVLLFSGGSKDKDDNNSRDYEVIADNTENDNEEVEDTKKIIEETEEASTEEAKSVEDVREKAENAAKEEKEKAQKAAEEAKEKAQKAAEEAKAKAKEATPPAKPVETPKPVNDNNVYNSVDELPSFPGGISQWLSQNLQYPPIAQENGIQGTVVVQFVVEKNGSLSDVKVIRSKDPSLDNEALRVVRNMPKWKPGKLNGSPVRVSFTLPITFKLQ